ncbi:hypothetical protein V6N11_024598 [Hibiscus sabdariffa]|uniref:Uncharacterized protein n=1 Tax=Hibiscus sabdariffa TaxID=183260 RepID=A0ABR2QML0_9ROSI
MSILSMGTIVKRSGPLEDWKIKFRDTNSCQVLEETMEDSLVVSAYSTVRRILMNNESVVEILQWSVFQQMRESADKLKSCGLIYGFSNILEDRRNIIIVDAKFLVVYQPSLYIMLSPTCP